MAIKKQAEKKQELVSMIQGLGITEAHLDSEVENKIRIYVIVPVSFTREFILDLFKAGVIGIVYGDEMITLIY